MYTEKEIKDMDNDTLCKLAKFDCFHPNILCVDGSKTCKYHNKHTHCDVWLAYDELRRRKDK